MIYLKLFEGFKDIDAICMEYDIKNYTINRDGTIDVDDTVFLSSAGSNKKFYTLPLKFNIVSDSFDCSCNNLTTLEGAPKEVGGYFSCNDNNLITLEGGPKKVGRNFICHDNKLTSLKGAPKEVGGYFNCGHNQLTSLEGAPKWIGGDFYCEGNPLPQLIYDNYQYIEEIIKWQDEYNIWRGEKLDEFRFGEMMIDIKEELKK